MNGKIYEKPKSKEEAYKNLKEMSGKITNAVTGVTIKDLYKDKEVCFADVAEVHLREIDYEDIKWYIENEKDIFNRCGYAMLDANALEVLNIQTNESKIRIIFREKVEDNILEQLHNELIN